MPAGDAFSVAQRREIDHAIATASQHCGYRFSVYVGASEATTTGKTTPRAFAEWLHARLEVPADSVLVFVDPGGRRLEIVTGERARKDLIDADTALVALSMQGSFAVGDLVGGIVSGVWQLADHARHPETLHTETA